MKLEVMKQGDAKTAWEGPELCRYYWKTEKITFGISTLEVGQTGDVDPGHPESQEVFYVVRGNVSLRTPDTDERYILNEGDAVLIPETVPHELTNVGNTTAVVSWSLAPSVREQQ